MKGLRLSCIISIMNGNHPTLCLFLVLLFLLLLLLFLLLLLLLLLHPSLLILHRMGMSMGACAFARLCYDEAFKYTCKRETFGKKLIEHPVIRAKLANMIKKVEST